MKNTEEKRKALAEQREARIAAAKKITAAEKRRAAAAAKVRAVLSVDAAQREGWGTPKG